MTDKILLAPYYWSLRLRHRLFDAGIRKSHEAGVPTICIGNVTVGGTGKTPHTEMIIRMLSDSGKWNGIAVLSRGYKRKSKGFQIVEADGTAEMYGDEPLQIKKKFPDITVAVDADRVAGCGRLADGDGTGKHADIIILDDAFQHRRLKPTLSIVLVDWYRPIFSDHLLPLGQLRDIPERVHEADIVIVSKCPPQIEDRQRREWAEALRISSFNEDTCEGVSASGKHQTLLFTTIDYDNPEPVMPEGDRRYTYSKKLILFSGIANDTPLSKYLSDNYKIVRHIRFGDHHSFTKADMHTISKASASVPEAVVMTTEKDCRRIAQEKCAEHLDRVVKTKMFYTPIKVRFTSGNEEQVFMNFLESRLK